MATSAQTGLSAQPASRLAAAVRKGRTIWVLAALAVALLAAGLVAMWVSGDDDQARRVGEPMEVSTEELVSLARSKNHPVYWAGTTPGNRYELTETDNGAVYVRYLPGGARVGDRRPLFTTIATYPMPRAYQQTASSAERKGAVWRNAPGGGIAVWSTRRPSSVYLAYPGTDLLVEVFSPAPGRARELALEGDVGPIR